MSETGNDGPMSLDEIEAAIAEPEVEEVKEETPPPANDTAWQAALRISEEARTRAEAALNRPAPVASQPEMVDPIENLTDDQIQQIIDEKGQVAAIRAIQLQTFRIAEKHMEKRLGGMAGAAATTAESSARSKYATEFELFGDQIDKQIAQIPNREALANPENWDNLIAYIRGKEGNIQKYVEKLGSVGKEVAANGAREQQKELAGVHSPVGGGKIVTASAAGPHGLDALELEIADKLGMEPADYAKWKGVK